MNSARARRPGALDYAFFVPDAAALVGVVMFHQMVPAEVDAQLQFTALTATNALRFLVGMF